MLTGGGDFVESMSSEGEKVGGLAAGRGLAEVGGGNNLGGAEGVRTRGSFSVFLESGARWRNLMLRGSRRGCRTQLVGWTPNLREVATLYDGTGSEVGG